MKKLKLYEDFDEWNEDDFDDEEFENVSDITAYLYSSPYADDIDKIHIICVLEIKDDFKCLHFIDDDTKFNFSNTWGKIHINGHEIIYSNGYLEFIQEGSLIPVSDDLKNKIENDILLIDNDYDSTKYNRNFKYSYLKEIFGNLKYGIDIL